MAVEKSLPPKTRTINCPDWSSHSFAVKQSGLTRCRKSEELLHVCGVEVWRGGLGRAYRLPTLSFVGASLAGGPAGGRAKRKGTWLDGAILAFFGGATGNGSTPFKQWCALQHRLLAWFQVPCAKQWLTAGGTWLIPFGRVSSLARLGRCL